MGDIIHDYELPPLNAECLVTVPRLSFQDHLLDASNGTF